MLADKILEHPIYLLYILPPLLLAANWWYIFFIYSDASKRNLRHKISWSILAYFIGPWLLPFYNAKTQREQTILTSSPVGMVAGEKLERIGKKGKIILAIVALIWLVSAIIYILKSYDNLTTFFASQNASNHILYNFVAPFILFLYSILSIKNHGKLNPLDKPLWGMRTTPEGYLVDESLTKHNKTVKFLIAFIISIPILLIFWLWIASMLGY